MEKASFALDAADFPSYGDTTTKGKPKIEIPDLEQSFENVPIVHDDKAGAKALEMSPPALPPRGDPWYEANGRIWPQGV